MNNVEDFVKCPLVDKLIDIADCIENRDIVNNLIKDINIPIQFTKKNNWKDICKKCKYNDF